LALLAQPRYARRFSGAGYRLPPPRHHC
jgi:hypothetical protein